MTKKRVLIIAAHPDDEVLGCGASSVRMADEDCEIFTLILGRGVASRYSGEGLGTMKRELDILNKEMLKANVILKVKKVFTYDFPDNRFDSVPILDIVKTIEDVKKKVKPTVIFTHDLNDLNIDHQITYKAVITAARPLPGETVKEIYSFEVPSSSEWNYPAVFSPNLFIDVTGYLGSKMKAMREYKTELKKYPHPRSIEGIEANAKRWGMTAGVKYAEAFKVIRITK